VDALGRVRLLRVPDVLLVGVEALRLRLQHRQPVVQQVAHGVRTGRLGRHGLLLQKDSNRAKSLWEEGVQALCRAKKRRPRVAGPPPGLGLRPSSSPGYFLVTVSLKLSVISILSAPSGLAEAATF